MPRPRFDKLEPEVRERLLEAAATEFAAHGFDGASLNRLIEAAGISKGAFYYYFDDKADLFRTVVLLAWELMCPAEPLAIDRLERDDFWPALREKFLEVSARAGEKRWLAGIGRLVYHPPRSARVDALLDEQFARVRRLLGAVVERGQQLGVVRNDLPKRLLLATVLGAGESADRWLVDHWEELDPDLVERIVPEVFEMLRGLVTPPAGAGAIEPPPGFERPVR